MSPALRRGAPFHKHDRGWGRPNMRLPASEKLEIIGLVEQSHLPARRTLQMLGIKPSTFYLYGRLSRCKTLKRWGMDVAKRRGSKRQQNIGERRLRWRARSR
jgi:hypothetical protein